MTIVKSYATRPPRNEEERTRSMDHIFISEDEVEQYIDKIVAYTKINGYQYFTTTDILDKSDVYLIDPIGIESLFQHVAGRYNFVFVYISTDPQIALERAKLRGDDLEVFQKRRADENAQFDAYEKSQKWDLHIKNNTTIEDAVGCFETLLPKEEREKHD